MTRVNWAQMSFSDLLDTRAIASFQERIVPDEINGDTLTRLVGYCHGHTIFSLTAWSSGTTEEHRHNMRQRACEELRQKAIQICEQLDALTEAMANSIAEEIDQEIAASVEGTGRHGELWKWYHGRDQVTWQEYGF